ncbi:MAG: hypothetical protein IKT41_05750 [Clostridia bacterium]|nr:hypothetical protein [Clostridia bacterium]
MKNKILYLVMLIITIIGAIIVGTKGFEFDIAYRKTKMIEIYIGKEFSLNDIKDITNEVMPSKEVKLNKVGEFENTVAITVDNITDEEFELLIQKTNEKYELENKKEDILSVELAHTRLRDIVKPYIIPVIIVTIITLIYFILIFRKVGIINIFIKYLLNVVLPEATIISLMAIVGIYIAEYTLAILIALYGILLIAQAFNLKTKSDKIKSEENNK